MIIHDVWSRVNETINDKFNSTVCVKEYIEIVGVSDFRFRDGQE